MGQEIDRFRFTEEDFNAFHAKLQSELRLLETWFAQQQLSSRTHVGGFELEVWIVDGNYRPLPINESYLERLHNEWVSPELSRFNIELNGTPVALQGRPFSRMQSELDGTWQRCREVAREFDAGLVMTGILPSVEEGQLVLGNMSSMKRYYALNEQIIRQRAGRPLKLDIVGHEHLQTVHHDVMLESATTSFQVHWQVSQQDSVRAYNASIIASAATVAVSANSPFLFGKDLWAETRIPLFEQSVEVGGFAGAAYGPLRRVSFGSGYARQSLLEVYQENYEHFPILLPITFDTPEDEVAHTRLHNGTIWRWNRPLIGFDEDGTPHLRIEHRVIPAGPTLVDGMANAAFFFGLAHYLARLPLAPEQDIRFTTARDNFYSAARHGLPATVTWLEGRKGVLQHLLQQQLCPFARRGLQLLGVDAAEIEYYMDIIEARVANGQNGSVWQRSYRDRHHCDMPGLTAAYAERQHSGAPVHTWAL